MKKFLLIIFIIINAITAVCLLIAYASCFISPEKIWLLTFFGLFYNYILIANLFFIIIWLFTKKKKLVFISLLPVLFSLNMTGRNFRLFARENSDMSDKIKVASYNVSFFHGKNRHDINVFQYLKETSADIICMQEFVMSQWHGMSDDSIAKWLDKPYYHIEQPGRWAQGVATYSRYPIIRNQLVYHDTTLYAAMYSDIVIRTDTVRVFNMHLRSTGLRTAYDNFRKHKQGKQLLDAVKDEYANTDLKMFTSEIARNVTGRAKQADQIAGYIADSPYPVIICGDFNDSPVSYPYQKIRGGNKDAFIRSGKGRGVTYNIRDELAQRIDFILYDPVYRAYNYNAPRVDYSDHFPVMCDLVKRKKK